MPGPIIYWYRNDLRLSDLRGLALAAASGRPVLACYILDDVSPGQWCAGAASRWWLHHSLLSLSGDIASSGGRLYLARGEPVSILADLARRSGATDVFCSRQYEPWTTQLEGRARSQLAAINVGFKCYPGALLWEPEEIFNRSGQPFKVFTPFWRNCLARNDPGQPSARPAGLAWHSGLEFGEQLTDWQLTPSRPDWAEGWGKRWHPGEPGANARLSELLADRIGDYEVGRDHPARESTSLLSAHLHFGEIAPVRVFHRVRGGINDRPDMTVAGEKFLSQIGWREFAHHLLFHFPHLPERAFKPKFDRFPWLGSAGSFECWRRGQTGYPLVDAGMRELWASGHMHNRVRMIVASFLCKHLLVDWRAGQAWFWDTLVDADLANNACGWQWVAGSGADASPYFRIFNPTTQARKFDGAGDYIRRWVPELSSLPNRYIHHPWTASQSVLEQCKIKLGETYPLPMVEHRQAREAALAAYDALRAG